MSSRVQTLTFEEGTIKIEELEWLFKLHYAEVGSFQNLAFDPDYKVIEALAASGNVRCFYVKDCGRIVGYSIFTISNDLFHKDKTTATEWVTYIHPTFRGRGYEFIKFVDKHIDADILYRGVKTSSDHGAILKRAGYQLIDMVYGRLK